MQYALLRGYRLRDGAVFAERPGLAIELSAGALLVRPGETFDLTVAVKSGLDEPMPAQSVWMGLQFVPAGGPQLAPQSAGTDGVSWEQVEDGKASWRVVLAEEGEFRAIITARIPCNKEDQNSEQRVPERCFQSLPVRQGAELKVRAAQLSAKLAVSWTKPQTVEALSDLSAAPQGVLQVSAWALDGSGVLHAFKGSVQLVAVDTRNAGYSPLERVLGGIARANLENGVAAFPKIRLLQPGTYKLVALAEGARAAETAPLLVTAAPPRVLR